MSRTKFLNELDDYLEKKNDDKKHETIEELFTEVGRIWIRDKRFKELISFIHDEYDTGQFTPFISEVENALLQQNLLQEFKVLWKGILRMRIERLWDWKKYFEENKISRNRLLEQQEFALKGIDRFLHGLAKFNDKEEINKTELIRLSVKNLDRPKPAPTTDKRKIDETLFWELINFSREATNNRFDFKESLKNKLSAFRPDEIRKFHKIFLTKFYELNTWENWALAYVYRRGCGDDEFDYFKAWVISKGKFVFDLVKNFVIEKLISVLTSEDPQFEEFIYLAEEVYESKTNDILKTTRIKTQKIIGKEWSEIDITIKYPELCKMFNFKS